ncbi:ABC transporter permease [Paracoccus aminophilus]|uniref:Spermidine/putrescine transport system, permease protein n=1 Tax=Paracoccus aminophilus JCM 7686 TaxID=1367847 RepID=S5YUE0_PARAH|nr:ABC transporter permease [Paracoccus aminophilus]AGT08861.1 spermidine/putrescine transport system, permease protein [Paracoccus aminophilus JCM 7686]
MKSRLARLRALLLVLPLAGFMLVFFIGPLVSMLSLSVSDGSARHVIPTVAERIADWDGEAAGLGDLQRALVTDLAASPDDQAVGEVVRRLNSSKSGFRSLFGKTLTAVATAPAESVDLAALDKRWNDPAYWLVIQDALNPLTDRYLLAALDLQRDAGGQIAEKPAGEAANRAILLRTLVISGTVTLATVAIGFPFAMAIAASSGWRRALLLGLTLLPLWTSLLVRTAAWFILLQDKGLINQTLQSLGVISEPLALIFNRSGVIIAMTYVLLPLMILPVYSALIAIPANLRPAAASLGAGPLRAFCEVTLPLGLRGVLSGALLVFMSAIGYYITPALIGGPRDQMISSVIAYYATGAANWGMASALGVLLLAITLCIYAVYQWLSTEPAKGRS